MTEQDSVRIDLSDPEDIRRQLPAVRGLYQQKQAELAKLTEEAELWRQFVQYLSRIAGEPVPDETRPDRIARKTGSRAPAQDAAVAALADKGTPSGPADLYRYMMGNGFERYAKSANQVGANLWSAVKAGRIGKTPDGLYAPPGWEDSSAEDLLASQNGATSAAEGASDES